MIKLKKKSVNFAVLLYMAAPVCVWFAGWLKPLFAAVCIIALVSALVICYKKNETNGFIDLKPASFAAIILFALVFTWIAGIGGYYYQSPDYNWRNAMLRDLISYDWPVHYEYGASFVYYFALFLPAALVGKFVAWRAAYFMLYLWCAFGMTLLLIIVSDLLKAVSLKKVSALLLIFAVFSGLDAVGVFIRNALLPYEQVSFSHIEWWAYNLQYSSNMTLYMWVFNQALPVWLSTVMFLNGKNCRVYGLIIALTALYSPYALFGFVGLMLARMAGDYAKKGFASLAKDIFSPINLLSVFVVFVPQMLFLTSNNSAQGEGISFFGNVLFSKKEFIIFYFSFIVLEVLVYWLPLLSSHKNEPMFYSLLAELMFFPFIKQGHSIDFCMRATVPALFILMLYIMKKIFDSAEYVRSCGVSHRRDKPFKRQKAALVFLIVCLVIGSVTSLCEQTRAVSAMCKNKTLFLKADVIYTFGVQNPDYAIDVFMHYDGAPSFFWRYLARKS